MESRYEDDFALGFDCGKWGIFSKERHSFRFFWYLVSVFSWGLSPGLVSDVFCGDFDFFECFFVS